MRFRFWKLNLGWMFIWTTLKQMVNKVTLIGLNFASRKNSQNFLDLILRVSDLKNFVWIYFREWAWKQLKREIFGHKLRVLTGFSTQNAMLKISHGFNFASQQSHTFSRVLILRNWQKFMKTRNLISRKLIRLKYI